MISCPGCGGKNEPGTRVCDWCGKVFYAEHQQMRLPWLLPATAGFIAIVAAATLVVALLGLRSPPRLREGDFQATAAPAATQVLDPTATETDTPAGAAPEAAPAQAEFVRVANTGNQGAFIRREPRAGAPGIVAHRDGTILRIVGPDAVVQGQVWRNVEDQRGNRGWTPRDFLTASDVGF